MWIKFDEIKLISTAVKTVVFHQRRCGPYHALIDDPNRSSCKARKVDYSSKNQIDQTSIYRYFRI